MEFERFVADALVEAEMRLNSEHQNLRFHLKESN